MKTTEAKPAATVSTRKLTPFFGRAGMFGGDLQAEEQPFFAQKENKSALNKNVVQAKLSIGRPDDPYEREADQMAEHVVQRMSEPVIQKKEDCKSNSKSSKVQLKCNACKQAELQSKSKVTSGDAGKSTLQQTPLPVQAKCNACEKEDAIQPKKVDTSESALQKKVQLKAAPQKAETVKAVTPQPKINSTIPASHNVQAKCNACEQEDHVPDKEEEIDKGVQRKVQLKPIAAVTEKTVPDANVAPAGIVQRNGNAETTQDEGGLALEQLLNAQRGSGTPIPEAVRAPLEEGFGADFSNVSIHDDSTAISMNNELNAKAFTHGSDIYFNSGNYDTTTTGGQRLLAHELTHTIQQGAVNAADAPETIRKKPMVQRAPSTLGNIWDATGGRIVGAVQSGATTIGNAATSAYETGRDFLLAQVERLAPGLLTFLRGNIIETIRQRIIQYIDARFGTLLSRLQTEGFASILESLLNRIFEAVNRGVETQCNAVMDAARQIMDFVSELTGPAIRRFRELAAEIGSFLSEMWREWGRPAIDNIQRYAGEVWTWMVETANWLWSLTQPIRTAISNAWTRIKELFNIAWNDTVSTFDWLKAKAIQAWERVKEIIEPIRTPLMIIGGILLLLSPIGPIVAIAAAAPYVWEAIQWIASNFNEHVFVRASNYLHNVVFPAIQRGLNEVKIKIREGLDWLTTQLNALSVAVSNLLNQLGVISFLNRVQNFCQRMGARIRTVASMAVDKLAIIWEKVSTIARQFWDFISPLVEFVLKLTFLILNPWLWPIVIAAWMWRLLPDCYKAPLINWILGIMIAVLRMMPDFRNFGDAWPQAKGILLQHLEGALAMDDAQKLRITNRIATMISELDLALIGNQIEAVRQSPQHFDLQIQEELIGINADEPLPFERTAAAAALPPMGDLSALSPQDAALFDRESFTEDDISVDEVSMMELEPEMLEQILNMPDGDNYLDAGGAPEGSAADDLLAETAPTDSEEIADEEINTEGDEGSGAVMEGPDTTGMTHEQITDLQLDEMSRQSESSMANEACDAPQAHPGPQETIPEFMKIGPLTQRQRARFLRNQMWNGVKKWFRCNAYWVIPAAVLAIVTLIVLEIITEGLVTIAFEIIGAIMLGYAAVKAAYYLAEFSAKSIMGDIRGAAVSFARALAILAIEIVMAITFGLGETIRSTQRGLRAAWQLVRGAGRGIARGTRAVGRTAVGVGRAVARGELRTAGRILRASRGAFVRDGRIILRGLGARFGRGFRRLEDLVTALFRRLRFRRFKINKRGLSFSLFGEINPWILLANGTLVEITDDELRALLGGGRRSLGRTVTHGGQSGVVVGSRGTSRFVQALQASPQLLQRVRALVHGGLVSNTESLIRALVHLAGGPYLDELTRVIEFLASRPVSRFAVVLNDLAAGGRRAMGAEWVLLYFHHNPALLARLGGLEVRTAVGAFTRVYDAILSGVRLEFKNWDAMIDHAFLRQFIRDLSSGRRFQWIFSNRILRGGQTAQDFITNVIEPLLRNRALLRRHGVSVTQVRNMLRNRSLTDLIKVVDMLTGQAL